MPLITTTVSVDSQRDDYDQVVLNLVQGDYGARRFLFVPMASGVPISPSLFSSAKVAALAVGTLNPMLIDCAIENGKIYMTPTVSLTQYDDTEYQCQLKLIKPDESQLTSMKFTIYVHNQLYSGDAVEHTNTSVTSMEWSDVTKTLTLHLADGNNITVDMTHTHTDATTLVKGFMTTSQVTDLNTLNNRVNQDLKTTASPTFAAANIGAVEIFNNGKVTGLKFS